MLVHHDALRAHEECFRRAVHAPVDRHAAAVIGPDPLVGIAELREPGDRLRIIVLPVEADDGHDSGPLYLEQHLVLLTAFSAPGAPDIEQVPVTLEIGRAHFPRRIAETWKR